MEENKKHDFTTFIASRLINQTGDEVFANTSNEQTESIARAETISAQTSEPEISVGVNATQIDESTTFAKVDKSLISLGFFTPSSRRIKNQKIKTIRFTRNENGKKVEASVEFHPSPVYGLPVTADQDKFLALHHIITNILRDNGSISNPIRFTSAEMLRLLDKQRHSGKNYREIEEWLACLTTTSIISKGVVYKAGEKRYAQDVFHVFERATSVGKEMPDGTLADANYVWLSAWQLENINEKYLLPIDVVTYRKVRNHIAKALIPLLQVWLFASQRAGSFEKKYDELCEMLGLQSFKAPSRIAQQLRASFNELVTFQYLEKWRIERTVDGREFKIIFFHGPKFYRDQHRRVHEKRKAEEIVVVAESGADVSIPTPDSAAEDTAILEVSSRREARPETSKSRSAALHSAAESAPAIEHVEAADARVAGLVDELSARGIMPGAAVKLLESIADEKLDDVRDYIDYWDSARKAQELGPGFLYRLISDFDPLPSNFETRRRREQRLVSEQRRNDLVRLKDTIETEYEIHCSNVVERYLADLPEGEFDRRVAERKAKLLENFWDDSPRRDENAERMARLDVRAQSRAGLVPPFEDFFKAQLTSTAQRLDIDPEGLES